MVLSLAGAASVVTAAHPAPGVIALSPDEARRGDVAIGLARRPDLHPALVEVKVAGAASHERLLAIAPGAMAAAVADRLSLEQATLSVVRADGSQLRIPMPGLLAAAFAADASWLAAVDGSGALWRVSADTGGATPIASGPFLGPITIEPGGGVILASVASVEAPFIARLVRVDPADGSMTRLSDDGLVYGSSLLDDGALAAVVHEPGGTVVKRLAPGAETRLAELGRGAIHVAISPDGLRIAWERHGDGVYLLERGQGSARRIGPGSHPRFSPDGRALLVRDGEGSVLLAADGTQVARLAGPADFASCLGECER